MKTPLDPRHRKRQEIVKSLFAHSFSDQNNKPDITKIIIEKLPTIDETISKIAPEFPIDKINRVDLAILRLAVFELIIDNSQPPKVIVDEAIELAKEFGGESSPGFVNGALGNLLHE